MKAITALNLHIEKFLLNCVSSNSLEELRSKLKNTRIKTGSCIQINQIIYDIYQISIKKGAFYIGYIETDNELIIIGYHLNNHDVDENGNFIFITGSNAYEIGKINILINNGVRL
ncbi:hypothetical protein [Avibacterium avium]|uniref:hypothetical protein n=1 Tax=Avibacterium avium TaxID=751 RepID=UPI003BF79421